jgi:acetyl-CoA acyltransferase
MREVKVVGVGMTRFGKFLDVGLKALGTEAVREALADAAIDQRQLEAAFVGNAMAGLVTGQECIRGQVILRGLGLGGLPIYNMENACASASTAFHTAWMAVAGGMYDVVLALGVEKLYDADKRKSFAALGSAVDMEEAEEFRQHMSAGLPADAAAGAGESRSVFMDFYAAEAREHMSRYGTRREDYARVAAKNHTNGSLNPKAQFQRARTPEEVLAAPMIADPLTRLMCSPIGDGAAAAILCSADVARRLAGARPVTVRASVLASGAPVASRDAAVVARAARRAYEMAGIGPDELDMAEVHDASAPAEIFIYEELALCAPGEGGRLVRDGATSLGGRVPVNTSGGLLAKGHPVGATGIAQVVEVVEQLRGRAGARQVQGARVALTQNAGGVLDGEPAACAVHIFTG